MANDAVGVSCASGSLLKGPIDSSRGLSLGQGLVNDPPPLLEAARDVCTPQLWEGHLPSLVKLNKHLGSIEKAGGNCRARVREQRHTQG